MVVAKTVFEICDVVETSNTGVKVRLRSGLEPWLPLAHIELLPRRVMVPVWLARKIIGTDCGKLRNSSDPQVSGQSEKTDGRAFR
jgi:hypothetical protein